MKHHLDTISGVNKIFIEMSKGVVLYIEMCTVTNKYKTLINEMNEIYRCIRTLIIYDNVINKT